LTTGLLTGVRFIKDNRLLPRGFDKATAEKDIAVVGAASQDPDFGAGGDRVRYSIDVAGGDEPLQIDVELRYQPIGFRWAKSLELYDATKHTGSSATTTQCMASAAVRGVKHDEP
jgi:hypothetical protein